MRKDYRVYNLLWKEWIIYGILYGAVDISVSYLFFDSWIAFLILLPGGAIFLAEQRKVLLKRRVREMKLQFLDALRMTASSLQAGYSVENAFREAWKELGRVYEQETFIMRELQWICVQMDRNESIEGLLMDLGQRSGVDDIRSFAEVFLTAKRSGGDLLAIIRNTVSCIRQKQETLQEIETCLAGKVMEQNIMSLVPILILAYVRLASPEFLEEMYGSGAGLAVMTICFFVYIAAYFWGRRIVQIEV